MPPAVARRRKCARRAPRRRHPARWAERRRSPRVAPYAPPRSTFGSSISPSSMPRAMLRRKASSTRCMFGGRTRSRVATAEGCRECPRPSADTTPRGRPANRARRRRGCSSRPPSGRRCRRFAGSNLERDILQRGRVAPSYCTTRRREERSSKDTATRGDGLRTAARQSNETSAILVQGSTAPAPLRMLLRYMRIRLSEGMTRKPA